MTEILVLGAGMVGVSTALALQARGHTVTLVDRRGPGEETSYGNAGMIQAEAVEPYVLPTDPRMLWQIATGTTNDVALSYRTIANWVGPALRYAWYSVSPDYQTRIVPRWAAMIQSATADHDALIGPAGADDIIRRKGYRKLYRSARQLEAAAKAAARLKTRFGVTSAVLDTAELAAAEPAIRMKLAGAVHFLDAWSCTDPGELVRRYAKLFETRGGSIVTADANTFTRSGNGWAVTTAAGPLSAELAIVCLGPWSPALLRRFGHRIPMVLKRGYHRHFTGGGPDLPAMDVENGTFLSPMRQGLRVLTGAELTAMDAMPNPRQIARSSRAAEELFGPLTPVEATPWVGTRPCMPDMLPVMGKSKSEPGLWLNFGHAHHGFTLGPTAGRLLAEQIG